MKKIIVFLSVLLISASMAMALESVLIDFNQLIDDYQGENEATLIDLGSQAGTTFTDEQKASMNMSLYVPNWEVHLSNSSRTTINDSLSYVLYPTVNDSGVRYAGEKVLGIRVHFPTGSFNSYALVMPPFTIPAFYTNQFVEDAPTGRQFDGYGVLKNVGVIKSIKITTFGMNHPISLSVRLRNEAQEVKNYPMGYLDFSGWRELTWNNPNYISEISHRKLYTMPLYPSMENAVMLESIQFYRDAMKEGGDFIGYIKDIRVIYDQAVIQDVDTDLNHEEIWGIIAVREAERTEAELKRLGKQQVLRFLEEQKIHQDEPAEEAGSEE